MAALINAAARQLQKTVQSKLTAKPVTEKAYIVARNMIAINGQTWQCAIDGDVGQVVEVANRGTPSRADYQPASGGGSVLVTGGGGGTLSVNVESHQLGDTNIHRGELARTQAPWALAVDGSRTITGNMPMLAGVTIDGMDPSVHIANPAAHHDPATPGPGVTVTGQMLSIQPGAVSATTTNTAIAAGEHTHAVTATTDGNASRNALLKSSALGGLTLDTLTVREIKSTGDLDLNPTGDDVLPRGHIEVDLGDVYRKWRTIFAAELFVETLVAQEVMATIGGRIMVAPTTKHTREMEPGQTLMYTEHNIFLPGDFAYMQSWTGVTAQIEAVKILGSYTLMASGDYRWPVQRNLDGTGENFWEVGDAIVNLGGNTSRGSGYIELTATQTIHNQLGPNMVVYSRPTTGTQAWNSSKPVWAAGNLESFLDYSTPTIGQAFGNDLTINPVTGNFKGVTNDVVNGPRMWNTGSSWYQGATKVIEVDQATGINIRRDTASGANANRNIDWWIDIDDKLGGNLEQTPSATIRGHYSTSHNYLSLWAHSLDRNGANVRLLASKTSNGVPGSSTLIEAAVYNSTRTITLDADRIDINGELSDWVDVSLDSNWYQATGQWPFGVKRAGDLVFARGMVGRDSGGGTQGTLIATLPSGYIPARTFWVTATVYNGATYGFAIIRVGDNGQLTVQHSDLSNTFRLSMAGTFWSTATT